LGNLASFLRTLSIAALSGKQWETSIFINPDRRFSISKYAYGTITRDGRYHYSPIEPERSKPLDAIVQLLVKDTGIPEKQALELIFLIRLNWNSLVREAKIIKSGR
jgi:hypothetical protein